jgi:hypothetical protein
MIRVLLSAVGAALLAGSALAGQDPGAPAGDTPTAPEATVLTAADQADVMDALKIVCKRVQPPTGTRIVSGQTRQQMCMTRADWEQQEAEAREVLKERDRGICAPDCGS